MEEGNIYEVDDQKIAQDLKDIEDILKDIDGSADEESIDEINDDSELVLPDSDTGSLSESRSSTPNYYHFSSPCPARHTRSQITKHSWHGDEIGSQSQRRRGN